MCVCECVCESERKGGRGGHVEADENADSLEEVRLEEVASERRRTNCKVVRTFE